MDWRISSLWSIFLLKNPTVTNKTHIPLLKNNNKILFYIKKIKNKNNKGMVGHPIGGGRTTPVWGWGGFDHPIPAV
jgi:hypothetical protein